MFYLLLLTILLNFSFYARADSVPVSCTQKKRTENGCQGKDYKRISAGNCYNQREYWDQRPRNQAAKSSSLPKLPNLKNLKNIPTWAINHIKRPNHKFHVSACNCQHGGRLSRFFNDHARYNCPSHHKKNPVKITRPNTIFQIKMNNSVVIPPEKRLCMSCYVSYLYYGVDQVDLLLQKNKMNDTILYLPELRQNRALPTELPRHLKQAFRHRSYIPWVMKFYSSDENWDIYKPDVGEFSMAKYRDHPPLLGLDKYILQQKQLVGDAFSYRANQPYFELKEDPIAFLRRTFSKEESYFKKSGWYITTADSEQTGGMPTADSEYDSSFSDSWDSAHDSGAGSLQTTSVQSRPTSYLSRNGCEEKCKTGIHSDMNNNKVSYKAGIHSDMNNNKVSPTKSTSSASSYTSTRPLRTSMDSPGRSKSNTGSYAGTCSFHVSMDNVKGKKARKYIVVNPQLKTYCLDANDEGFGDGDQLSERESRATRQQRIGA